MIDDLFVYDGFFGVEFGVNDKVMLCVWVFMVLNVVLVLFDEFRGEETRRVVAMTRDETLGVWSVIGDDFKDKYYNFEVIVFNLMIGKVLMNVVLDLYVWSFVVDGRRAYVCDISRDDFKFKGWEMFEKLKFMYFVDCLIYELYVWDFSVLDEIVSVFVWGKYLVFCEESSVCVFYFKKFVDVGFTYVYLLLFYDFGFVFEFLEN